MTTAKPNITMQEALASLVPIIHGAVHKWMEQQDADDIQQEVFDTLNKAKNEVAPKLLGFSRGSWGNRWEIDHCNGRSGESALGDYLKKTQGAGIEKFFDQLDLTTVKPFTKTEIENLRSQYRQRVIERVRDGIRAQAEADAAKLLKSLSADDLVEAILKTEELLGTSPTIPNQEETK